ncbi:MAG: head-tail adaptor protein, partial [Pseudomonadota bacterium]
GSSMRPAPDQRFREGARQFVIRAVAERDPRGQYLTCFADEEVAA